MTIVYCNSRSIDRAKSATFLLMDYGDYQLYHCLTPDGTEKRFILQSSITDADRFDRRMMARKMLSDLKRAYDSIPLTTVKSAVLTVLKSL